MRVEVRGWGAWAVACLLTLPAVAAATTRSWPGSGGCATTLQACIDSATDGDRIEISTIATVDEDINLTGRSLTVTAPGTTAVAQFAPGRSIDAVTSSGGGVSLTLARLHFTDGHVRVGYRAAGTSTFDISGLIIERGVAAAPSYLRVEVATGTVNASVRENRINGVPASINSGLIELATDGGMLNAYVAYNKLVRSNQATSDGAGIFVDAVALGTPGAGLVRVFANEVRGDYNRSGIFFSEGLFSSTASSYDARALNNVVVCTGSDSGGGISFTLNNGSMAGQAINNTVSGCRDGIMITRWSGATAVSTVTGYVSNNVVTATYRALEFTPDESAGVANDYNLINAPGNLATLGAHTITAPAQLVAAIAPRLSTGSPGIDAADGNLLGNALIDAGLPTTDADGLRRVKGAGADIGAYESGDFSFEHVASAANTSGHVTTIEQAGLEANSHIIPTRQTVAGVPNTYDNFGVWLAFSNWTIYHEDHSTAVAAGKRWNVFAPATGGGVFTQTSSAANSGGWSTQIDNVSTNGYADRIVLARHTYNVGGLYDDHPNAVYWTGSGSSGHWNIANADQATLTLGSGFHVYAQPASPNAFRITSMMGVFLTVIDHPLINHVPCAAVHVTRVIDQFAPAASADFAVDYNVSSTPVGYWLVRSPVPFPANTQFNVVIDPAQVFACTDVIFANGFD
jgi:hypothetical protein